jgi:hypothetical protein
MQPLYQFISGCSEQCFYEILPCSFNGIWCRLKIFDIGSRSLSKCFQLIIDISGSHGVGGDAHCLSAIFKVIDYFF